MLSRYLSAVAFVLLSVFSANAQVGSGTLQGTVKDKKTGEALPFVSVIVENRGTRVASGSSDFDGNFRITPIEPGTYDVMVSFVGYQPQKLSGVLVNSNKITFINPELTSGVELKEVEVVRYKVPLIDKDGGASGSTVSREQIAKMPARSVNGVATTVAGASDAGTGGGVSIRGARTENTYYYIDGVKVPAGAGIGLPKAAIEEVQVITGGVPANYGDVTGGLVNITTRGPSRSFFGGIDLLSSGFKVGDVVTDVVGLDKYAFNQVEASLSGPIFFKKDSVGNKVKPLLGFFLSGQLTDALDNGPLYGGDRRVKPEVRDALLQDPLSLQVTGGDISAVYNSDLLRADDIESIPMRQNAGNRAYLGSVKFDIATTPTINLTVGGSLDYSRNQSYDRNNSLLNAENNTQIRNLSYRGFVRFTQRFSSREEDNTTAADGTKKKAGIKNAYYSVQLDYSRRNQNVEDPTHKDNLFDYGYIGRYQTFRAPTYALAGQRFEQTGFRDTLVTFSPGDANPTIATVTDQFFGLFPNETFPIPLLYGAGGGFNYVGYYANFDEIQSRRGLLNGQSPPSVYSLWNNFGVLSNNYSTFQQEQIRVSATGSADVGKHAVSVGVEYEQLSNRNYDLNPVGLWGRARALTNFHLRNLDVNNPTITYPLGTLPFYSYDRLVGLDQTNFDRNLRESLGLNPGGTDFIDVDGLDPSSLDLSYFSADELINEGNGLSSEPGGLISYYGYDHLGNKLTSKPSFEKFFTDNKLVGEDTLYSRLQAPFQPIYVAGYVMDKFSFDDIIFNVGIRVDRYDANQYQLKDKYLWRNAWTAGEAAGSDQVGQGIRNQLENRPGNIGDDYVVYVDNAKAPTSVIGYRNENTWYNAAGEVLADPSVLRAADGIQPFLIGYDTDQRGDMPGSRIRKDAFKVYEPVVNVMPRVAFSFPISDQAVFFAHYDILTQRPTSNSRLDLLEYAYIENTVNTLNNPALKPTKTIDYELGFQQVLSKSSSIKISAFYRELRDQIQVRNVAQAWPITYKTYDNIDFGTVKGFSLAYDLRRTGNIRMTASYTLQFADGTGSDPGTSLSLINSGQPNLRTISPLNFDQRHRFTVNTDFSYGSGTDYNGPVLFGKQFFQNTGVNFTSILGSGTPYSISSLITQEGSLNGGGNGRLVGSINGARLPWQFNTDMQIYRDIPVTFGEDQGEKKARKANINVYLLVTNLFNTRNITGVYRATGSEDDDGYLAAPQYQQNIENQVSEQSFRDLYAIKVNNPFNLGAPRTIRLGVRFDF
jgi:hypothetical protein